MRVRQWAVVGAAFAVALTGGAGIASATDDSTTDPGCVPLTAAGVSEVLPETLPEPCDDTEDIEVRAQAQVGCTGDGVLQVWVSGLVPGEEVTLLVDPDTENTFTAGPDGSAELYAGFDPTLERVEFDVEDAEGEVLVDGDEGVEGTCGGTGQLLVTGDCQNPETLFLDLEVTGLEPDAEYDVSYYSDGFVLNPGYSGNAVFDDVFTTDDQGSASISTEATEDEAISFSDGSFTVEFAVFGAESNTTSIEGSALAESCPVEEVVDPAPATPETHPVAAPVAVQPVAQHPAVLANTGTPTAIIALVGGGLLATGAGTLVATRRRA